MLYSPDGQAIQLRGMPGPPGPPVQFFRSFEMVLASYQCFAYIKTAFRAWGHPHIFSSSTQRFFSSFISITFRARKDFAATLDSRCVSFFTTCFCYVPFCFALSSEVFKVFGDSRDLVHQLVATVGRISKSLDLLDFLNESTQKCFFLTFSDSPYIFVFCVSLHMHYHSPLTILNNPPNRIFNSGSYRLGWSARFAGMLSFIPSICMSSVSSHTIFEMIFLII